MALQRHRKQIIVWELFSLHVTTETQEANELHHHRRAGEANRTREGRSTQTLLTATAEICMKTQVVLRYFLPLGGRSCLAPAGPQSFITSCRRQDELISGCAGEPQAVKGAQQHKGSIKGSDRFHANSFTPSFHQSVADKCFIINTYCLMEVRIMGQSAGNLLTSTLCFSTH